MSLDLQEHDDPGINYLCLARQERARAIWIGRQQEFLRALLTLAIIFSRNISELAKYSGEQ